MARSAVGTGIAALALAAAASPALATTITVTGTGDAIAADGNCVLREAITAANGNAASNECAAGQGGGIVDLIQFSITGAGPHIITPIAALPELSEPMTIDGGTDTVPGPGADEIRIDGNGASFFGLDIRADDTRVESLAVTRFQGGIQVFEADDVEIEDSFIGTTEAGTAGLGNTARGIEVNSSTDAEVRGTVVSGNGQQGIQITGAASSGNVVASNRIGTNLAGTTALANGSTGVEILGGADANTIGGPNLVDGNIVSANAGAGIRIVGITADRSTGNVIRGNRVGTTLNGEVDLGNALWGIELSGAVDDTLVRGNLVSGNDSYGVQVLEGNPPVGAEGPTGTTIAANKVGTDKDGTTAIGNASEGILINGTDAHPIADTTVGGTTGLTLGGACTGDCNLVSATAGVGTSGVNVSGAIENTEVLGNYIGTNAAGTGALPNSRGLVLSGGDDTNVGSAAAPNLISGNSDTGILVGAGTTGGDIQANLIGTAADGTTALPNTNFGIQVQGGTGLMIGGFNAGDGNVIANSFDGVRMTSGDAISVLGNSITGNEQLGINLFGTGAVEPNDNLDADTGANGLQNHPVLEKAVILDSGTFVSGELGSEAETDYLIEVFTNEVGHPSGHGEGEIPIGSFIVTTDDDGEASYAEEVAGNAPEGETVSATATELDGLSSPLSTSEFGPNVTSEACDIEGTSGDDPALAGTAASEVICGFGGDDVIDGGGGFDVIVGGSGIDDVDYSGAGGEITADLTANLVEEAGDGDTIVGGIENVIGSDFDDIITGDANANFVQANDGKDTIEGGEGDDELKGGIGGDTMKGGGGDDEVLSQDGGDVLKGQGGNDDELSAGPGKDNLNGGGGNSDHCNGGGNSDDTPAPGCESTSSIP